MRIVNSATFVIFGDAVALCMPAGGSLKPASHEPVDELHYVKQDGQTVWSR